MRDVDWTWTITLPCPGCKKNFECPSCIPPGGLVSCARIPFHNNCTVGEKGVKEYDSDDPRCM